MFTTVAVKFVAETCGPETFYGDFISLRIFLGRKILFFQGGQEVTDDLFVKNSVRKLVHHI